MFCVVGDGGVGVCGGEEVGLVFDIEDDAVFWVVFGEVLQGEGVVGFFIDADGERGVDVIRGDVREERLAGVVEGADNGDAVGSCGAHGEVWFIAFTLAVVLLVAFDVDDVGDLGGLEAFGGLEFIVELEIFVEYGDGRVILSDFDAFELFEEAGLEEFGKELGFGHFRHVLIVSLSDNRVLTED